MTTEEMAVLRRAKSATVQAVEPITLALDGATADLRRAYAIGVAQGLVAAAAAMFAAVQGMPAGTRCDVVNDLAKAGWNGFESYRKSYGGN